MALISAVSILVRKEKKKKNDRKGGVHAGAWPVCVGMEWVHGCACVHGQRALQLCGFTSIYKLTT